MNTGPDFSRAVWRKSSRSNGNGGNCVEVAHLAGWRKSSRSSGNGGNCVEVARAEAVAGVRDSKNADGPVLVFPSAAVAGLISAL